MRIEYLNHLLKVFLIKKSIENKNDSIDLDKMDVDEMENTTALAPDETKVPVVSTNQMIKNVCICYVHI